MDKDDLRELERLVRRWRETKDIVSNVVRQFNVSTNDAAFLATGACTGLTTAADELAALIKRMEKRYWRSGVGAKLTVSIRTAVSIGDIPRTVLAAVTV